MVCILGQYDLLVQLLHNPRLDLTACDYENKWNCLHWTVFKHNCQLATLLLSSKLASQLVRSKDREGFTPLDLLLADSGIQSLKWYPESVGKIYKHRRGQVDEESAIREVNLLKRQVQTPVRWTPQRGGSSIVYFGKDILDPTQKMLNVTLPNPPSDLLLDQISTARIRDVKMSKTHRLILTCSKTQNVFTAGVGVDGRLGTGNSRPQQSFVRVVGFQHTHVIDADVSEYHSVVLTADNEVYTWGSNSSAQLGYQADIQTTPRIVNTGDLKKKTPPLLGVSCSKFHTLAYTKREIYIWGLNLGQFGFSAIGHDSQEKTPHVTIFKHDDIKQVSATDHFTIVLTESDHIHIYMKGYHAHIQPPLLSKIDDSNFNSFRPRALSRRKKIVKLITQKNSSVCLMLYDNGDISEFGIDLQAANAAELVRNAKFSTSWKASKRHMRCVDADLGNEDLIIICVEDGSVYKRIKRSKVKHTNSSVSKRYKFERIVSVNRVVRVVTDPLFEKFAFIRDEIDMLPHRLVKSSVFRDIGRLSPLYELDDRLLQRRTIIDKSRQPLVIKQDTFLANFVQSPQSLEEDNDDDDDENESCEDDLVHAYNTRWAGRPNAPVTRMPYKDTQNIEELLKSDDIEYLLELKDLTEGKHYDCTVKVHDTSIDKHFEFRAHKLLLTMRCPLLAKVFEGTPIEEFGIKISAGDDLAITGDVSVRTVAILLHFLYTDEFLDVWTKFPLDKVPADIQRARVSFENLSRLVGVVSPLGRIKCRHSLLRDLQDMLSGEHGDVTVELEDGSLQVPSFLLCARSAYFETLLRWDLSKDISCEIPTSLFKSVLKFIAGVNMTELAGDFQDSGSLVNFCLELNEVAGAFILDEMSDMCQLCVKDFVDLDNFDVVTEYAYDSGARKLFENCIWFIYNNLSLLLFDPRFKELVSGDTDLSRSISAGIVWFDSLKVSEGPSDSRTFLFRSEDGELVSQFLSDLKTFDSNFVHPLLWDALGSFKEEQDLKIAAKSQDRRRKSSLKSLGVEGRSDSFVLAHRSFSAGSTDSLVAESAIEDGQDDEFVVVKHGRRSSSSHRHNSNTDRRPSSSKIRQGSISRPVLVGSSWNQSPSPVAAATPSFEDILKKEKKQQVHAPKYKAASGGIMRKSQKERKKENIKPVTPPKPASNVPWASGSTWKPVSSNSPKGSIATAIKQPVHVSMAQTVSQQSALPGQHIWHTSQEAQKPVASLESVLLEEKLNRQKELAKQDSLDDLRREQEFARWWAEESARVQNGTTGTEPVDERPRRGSKNRRRRAKRPEKRVTT